MVTMTTIQPPSAFLPFLVKMSSKITQNPKLCEVIDLSLLSLKIWFLWGWACQILGRDKWKNRDKTRKMLNFPGLWRGTFTVCPWVVRTTPILPFWPQIRPLTLELSQTTPKSYVFEQIFKHSLNFEPLPFSYFWAKFQIWLCHPVCS